MQKIISIVLSLLLVFNFSYAQDCNEESLLQKPGTWKPGMKGSEGGTATELAKEKKVVETIHNMIKSKYSPTAVQALFHGAYSPAYANTWGNSYIYSIIPLNYYCEGNATKVAHETPSEFAIYANSGQMEFYNVYSLDGLTYGTGYHYIKDMPVQKDGYWWFKEKDEGAGYIPTRTYSWLVTYDGKLPFAYVTKKEFLQARKVILKNAESESARQAKSTLDGIEIERGYKEKEYKNDPAKLAHYMKMDYNNIKERYEKLLADNEKRFKPAFDKIDALLKMPEAELNQPAIVKMDPHDALAYLFVDDEDPMGEVLVKPNPAYFNKKLPRSSPQFFWVSVRANQKDPIAAKFMTDIMKAVDFTTLKNMLGK